jgi:dephospho-CoA kinase
VSTSEEVVIVGLTGGIATGKSRVIDADVVARDVVEPGTPALAEIQEAFGDGVIDEDGSLNRAALGEIVFGDDAARAHLNAITHPRIGLRMIELAHEAGAAGFAWVIYDAALLIENKLHEMLPATIVVACSEDTQLERLMQRDDFDEEAARARIAAQLPIGEKIAVADWVIDNEHTLDHTRAQVENVFGELSAKFGALRTTR